MTRLLCERLEETAASYGLRTKHNISNVGKGRPPKAACLVEAPAFLNLPV